VQGSSELKAKARGVFIVISWGRHLFCPMKLLILEKQQQFTVVGGTGASPFGKAAVKRQFASTRLGEESVHLLPLHRPCLCSAACSPVSGRADTSARRGRRALSLCEG